MSIIYWDFDGTLTYSNSLWPKCAYNALSETLPKHNISYLKLREKILAEGFTWHEPDNDYSKLKNVEWWNFINEKIKRDYISLEVSAEIAEIASKRVRDHIMKIDNYVLYPDAIDTLKELKERNHKNFILSNNFPELEAVISLLGIHDYFDGFIVSAIVGFDKPRKELFDLAKNFNMKNDTMYMIGDTVSSDIIGGKNAGMITILVHRGECDTANYCCSNLMDVIDIIK